MTEFHKLVRDKIPDMIRKQGETAHIRILEDTEYRQALENKLDEEAAEFHESKKLEELADILEVIYALAESQGASVQELLNVYEKQLKQIEALEEELSKTKFDLFEKQKETLSLKKEKEELENKGNALKEELDGVQEKMNGILNVIQGTNANKE